MSTVHTALVALYLRGAPRAGTPNRRLWPEVTKALREEPGDISRASRTLRGRGLAHESALLDDHRLIEWAEAMGEHAVTCVSAAYPSRWLSVLGPSAPPALWARGDECQGPLLGIVGSRRAEDLSIAFAFETGAQAVEEGFAVVSGGAEGCDRAGVAGCLESGGRAAILLPCGFGWAPSSGALDLSVCAPDEPFSTANAMERNALIYAASNASVVAHAHLRQGGTWHGSIDALRRRLTSLIVREDDSPASRALIGLGAIPLASPKSLSAAIAAVPRQGVLFGG